MWRKARDEGELGASNNTSSAHLLCMKSEATKQVKMKEF
jgi:hypothetical protein